jgi:hypothetical protein
VEKIVKVLDVVDTRDYEEVADGVFKPVAGSGTESDCARCARIHLVHAHVLLSDGTSTVVGTGCMGKESMELGAVVRKATAAVKRLGKLRAELAAEEAKAAEYARVKAEVEALPLPEITHGTVTLQDGRTIPAVYMGDAKLWLPGNQPFDAQEDRTLATSWRRKREQERGMRWEHTHASHRAGVVREKIEKLERKIKRTLGSLS